MYQCLCASSLSKVSCGLKNVEKRYMGSKRQTENSDEVCEVSQMVSVRRLPLIVMGRSMAGDPSTTGDPKITLELEAETGEIFEICFSLRGILSTVVMAHNWTPLREELAQMEPPTIV